MLNIRKTSLAVQNQINIKPQCFSIQLHPQSKPSSAVLNQSGKKTLGGLKTLPHG
jgi:hypothetical protein